jgi:hypothetical protein
MKKEMEKAMSIEYRIDVLRRLRIGSRKQLYKTFGRGNGEVSSGMAVAQKQTVTSKDVDLQ